LISFVILLLLLLLLLGTVTATAADKTTRESTAAGRDQGKIGE
jgi:hypothetical protein